MHYLIVQLRVPSTRLGVVLCWMKKTVPVTRLTEGNEKKNVNDFMQIVIGRLFSLSRFA